MWEEGCDGLSAIIRDDNVGSWKMFLQRGFKRGGLDDMVRSLGWIGGLKQYFGTPMKFATGMEYYLMMKDQQVESKKSHSVHQMINYYIFTVLFLLPLLIKGIEYTAIVIGAVGVVLAARIFFGYLGTLFSKGNWQFRVADGGFIIPIIVNISGGIYIMVGNWYPRTYKKDTDFKRSLRLTALAQWISLFLISILGVTPLTDYSFMKIMTQFSKAAMILSICPFYPLASFGGKRIYDWNTWIFAIILVLTMGAMYSI